MGHPQQSTQIPVVTWWIPETQQEEDGEEQLSDRMPRIQLWWFKQPLHLPKHTLNSLLADIIKKPFQYHITKYINIYRTLKGPNNIKC